MRWLGAEQPHRGVMARVTMPGVSPMIVGSVYCMVREGMNKSNLELLASMIQTLESTCLEGMVCGDYNMTVPTVLGSGLVLQARMQVARAGVPTYVSSKSAVER